METAPAGTCAVESDWPCCVCDYNLRGLSPAGLCPECGTPIQQSLDFRYLGNSNPRWLKTIRRSATNAAVVTAFTLCYAAFNLFAPIFTSGAALVWRRLLFLWPSGIFALANFAAMWAIVRPEPGGIDPREGRSARLVRAVLCISILLMFVPYVTVTTYSPIDVGIRSLARSLAAMSLYFLFFRHVRRIAHRIPAARLQAAFGLLSWTYPSATALSSLLPQILMLAGIRLMYTTRWIEMTLFVPTLVIRGWSAFELWQLASKLRRIVPVGESV